MVVLKIYCTGIGCAVDSAVDHIKFQELLHEYGNENTICNIKNNYNSIIEKFIVFTESSFQEAILDADLHPNKLTNDSRVGVVIGSSLGIIDSLMLDGNSSRCKSLIDFSWLIEKYQIKGPVYTVSNACVSGVNAIAIAMGLLEQNQIDTCIVGGVDIIGDFIINGFCSMKILSKGKKLELFSHNQDGTFLSSGAGFLVLEKEEILKNSYARILTSAITNDAYDLVGVDMSGDMLKVAILECVHNACLNISDIDLVITCANGIQKMDIQQANLINKLFTEHDNYVVSSIKPLIGHTLGASGILDVIAAVEFMNNGQVIPLENTNYYDLPHTFLENLHGAVRKPIEHVLILSAGFSGVNGAILLGNSRGRL